MSRPHPHTFLNSDHAGLIVMPDLAATAEGPVVQLIRRDLPSLVIESVNMAPWRDTHLCDHLDQITWKQAIIVAGGLSAYLSALSVMCLETGLQVHLALDNGIDPNAPRIMQLRQFGISIKTPVQIIEDLTLAELS